MDQQQSVLTCGGCGYEMTASKGGTAICPVCWEQSNGTVKSRMTEKVEEEE